MDWLGLALLSLALLSLSVALTVGNGMGWLSPGVLALFSVSFLSVVVLRWVEKSKVPALLDFDLFRAKNFTAACIVGFLSYFIGIGWLYVISIFLQHVYHLTPLQAGLAVLPFSIGYFLTGMATGRLVRYFSRKSLVQVGFAIAAVSTGSLAILPGTHHSAVMGAAFLLMAVGFAGIVSTSIATGLQYVPQVKVGLASGKSMMFRWLGSAIGVATCSAVFEAQSVSKGQSLLAQMPVFDRVMGEFLAILRGHLHAVNIPDPWQKLLNAAYTSGLHTTMILLCALSLLGLWVSWQFLHHD
jgi:MFS family permease